MAYVVLYGPDDFPVRRNLNMEKSFSQIREGFEACRDEFSSEDIFHRASSLLIKSEIAYGENDAISGAHFLQEIMEII
ncbi:hypothetical protein [Chromobacterium alticapitis]|uniref:hypothetical protein n=1 Tax=Chromobacterium alticapitis TaxID=2073169 RepID=UPI0011AFD58D|nr:hypothetical protein [Chromobacterium alticapitis]